MTPIHITHPNSLSRRSEPVQIPHVHRVLSDAQNDTCSEVAVSDSSIDESKPAFSRTHLPLLLLQIRRQVKLDAHLMLFSSIQHAHPLPSSRMIIPSSRMIIPSSRMSIPSPPLA
ncbi:hypothetical protein BLNAU_20621 [Blattamonas nauphoetae]|uniref:Uncharacterized protein n=1 Tax=Blattamonas nauphoetae TaxID=2049346 RepID=A0ABQ9WYR7_9EUKA|nr:hypothetical protein BLNAU_20621 [Blattamonas nauphoetae]